MGEAKRRGTRDDRIRAAQEGTLCDLIEQFGSRDKLNVFISSNYWNIPKQVYDNNPLLAHRRRRIENLVAKLGIEMPPKLNQCPQCEEYFTEVGAALSRKDNETVICHKCGTAEGLEEIAP